MAMMRSASPRVFFVCRLIDVDRAAHHARTSSLSSAHPSLLLLRNGCCFACLGGLPRRLSKT